MFQISMFYQLLCFLFLYLPNVLLLALVLIFCVEEFIVKGPNCEDALASIGKSLSPIVITALPTKFLKSGKNLLILMRYSPSPSCGISKSPESINAAIAVSAPFKSTILVPVSCAKYLLAPKVFLWLHLNLQQLELMLNHIQ